MNKPRNQNLSVPADRVHAQVGILKWVKDNLLPEVGFPLHKSVMLLSDKIFEIARTRGLKESIRFSKEIRGEIFRFLSSNEDLDNPTVSRAGIWLPKDIKDLKVCGSGEVYPLARLLLTVTYTTRGFLLPPVLDTSTITAPCVTTGVPAMGDRISDFWKCLRAQPYSKHRKKLDWTKYHLSVKAGPNGQALSSAMVDV